MDFHHLAPIFVLFAITTTAAAERPDSHTQPLLDGCQRSDALELGVSTPEWVYVDRTSVLAARLAGDARAGVRSVEGTVIESRPAGEDLYVNHDFHDLNVMVRPDAAFEELLGTGNPEEEGLEGEWEAPQVPLWAWPQVGDRVRQTGSWIWDCGHWGNSAADPTGISQLVPFDPVETGQDLLAPGAIRGETTEIHPMQELATFRKNAADLLAGYGPRALSRLDVWIDGDGTPALASEECALLGVQNGVVARLLCSRYRDVGGHYAYTLPLGPAPSATSTVVVNPLDRHAAETDDDLEVLPVAVTPDAARGVVEVSFDLPFGAPRRFGLSVVAGWSDAPAAVHHRVTLDEIHIEKSLDGASESNMNPFGGPEQTPDPGEWVLYANVSGHWQQVPGIAQVESGQTIPLGLVYDFHLPPGVTPTLFVSGRECDEPLIDCEHESYGAAAEFPALVTEIGFNDRPGRIEDGKEGVTLAPGQATYRPEPNPSSSGNEDLSDPVCGPASCYQVKATRGD